jgi:hypothetical protein
MDQAPVPYGPQCVCRNEGCARPARPDSVEHGGYSPFFPNSNVNVATLYDAGGYASYVDTQTSLQPDLSVSNGTRRKCVFLQNMGGLQPHYGQQYPDRQPEGLNVLNERSWRRDRLRNIVTYPV